MNIVRINEAVFKQLDEDNACGFCWKFTYARKDYANLKGKKDCCIQVFMENFTTEKIRANDGLVDYVRHSYTLKILTDSLFDIQIFNELEPDDAKSKFAEYVEPIIDCFPEKYVSEICSQKLSVSKEKIVALYNRKDQNQDGIEYQVVVRDEC